jgi:CPA1 family monovalent cation:H+ antiporter
MSDLPSILIIVAFLLSVISLVQPVARLLRLSQTVILAVVGIAIAAISSFLLHTSFTDLFNKPAELILDFPITSQVFIFLFLPILLFQASLTLDVRRLADDAAPILVMAVVAVVVTTAVVGLALDPFAGVPLAACLMLGAIVATTDPAAVVAIFRDLGAPPRLTRLVEGESLLNDATAIAIFAVLLGYITADQPPAIGTVLLGFVRTFAGGVLVGALIARAFVALLPLVRDLRAAEVTLTLALPYLIFIICERYLHVSGVVAVVAGGLVLGAMGRSRISPENWRFLDEVWEQLGFWASSLIFILAAMLVPRMVRGIDLADIGLVLVVVLACLVARAAVLFGLLPFLSLLRLGQRVSTPYKTVILWGGLRGAVTLALALSITENRAVSHDIQRFIAIVATGYVLFTLLVNGTTLRPVIKLLRLDQLSPVDLALRNRVLAISLVSVRDEVANRAQAYHLSDETLSATVRPYEDRIALVAEAQAASEGISERDRLSIGLVALAGRERDVLLEHFNRKTASPQVLEAMLQQADRMVEAARQGRSDYNKAARGWLEFDRPLRVAVALHRLVRLESMLAKRLADRFETLLVSRIVLEDLRRFATAKLLPVLGPRMTAILREMLDNRIEATSKALDAQHLQYPDYAAALERRFLHQYALRLEEREYRTLLEDGLIGSELFHNLRAELQEQQESVQRRPRLDLRLEPRTLLAQFPMFATLTEEELGKLAGLLRPHFARPGEKLISQGAKADSMFFIASGAVEILLEKRRIRLGRGDFFGEMGLIARKRRSADVVALTHCHLLELGGAAFHKTLEGNAAMKEKITAIAEAREQMNATPEPDPEMPTPPELARPVEPAPSPTSNIIALPPPRRAVD